MRELKHLEIELSGTHLVEASAGTGKTFAIALLYLRILVELELEPKQILVVTFTEAATMELHGRIRRRIREALDIMDGVETNDELLRQLCANANGKWGQKDVRGILDRALKSFDTAAIFTIHGFCLRALQENAFESGSRYDTELAADQTGLLREVVDDFWRRSFFSDSARLLAFALKKNYSVDSLSIFAQGMIGNPKLKIIPECSAEEIAAVDRDCLSLFGAIRKEWRGNSEELVSLISSDKGLRRDEKNYRQDLLPALFAQMDEFVAGDNPYDLPAGFSKFTSSGIADGTKPTGTPPDHPFFGLCEELQRKAERRLRLFCGELIAYGNEQLPARKRQQNIRVFSDLLNDLYAALCSDGGAAFAAKLRSSYQAALIDEFQDTDPVQYDIFKQIYADTRLPLFLIGDPKQAIYSFRGADIFAYIQAAADVQEEGRFTLTSNWRSSPEMLDAFNRIFAAEKQPFIHERIHYHPVAAGKEPEKQLTADSGAGAPLQVWLMPPGDLNVSGANKLIPRAVAAEIARLLQEGSEGRASIGREPIVPADIAVIVRSHRQAASIREALAALSVPCVVRSDITIFATDEAREVCTLLQGLLTPGREPSVRAALVTDILGRSGSDMAALLEDEQAWDTCLEQFRGLHQTWRDRGFMVMARLLMEKEGVRGRLLRHPDGERRLTNLLHCFEVIHGKAHERGIGMEGLVTWFSERVSAREKKEEHEIRLETDEKAVKILTVHVSKGLEFPIVFCPYMWTGLMGSGDVATFHEGTAMVKDYGSDDFSLHRDWAEKEQLAESLRLLYVAVTRAQYRCYLYGGKVKSASEKSRPETSPLAYLFHASPETRGAEALVAALTEEFAGLSPGSIQEQMQQLAAGSDGTIWTDQLPENPVAVPWLPHRDADVTFSSRTFQGTIDSDWRVTSFTSFAAHESRTAELPDRDQSLSAVQESRPTADELPAGKTVFTFPKGAGPGIFMHSIFEELDFSAPSEHEIARAVESKLALHGFDRSWQPCIGEMVANVVSTPLPSGDRTFTLGELKKGSWLTELEFFFPLRFIQSDQLRRSLQEFCDGYGAVDLDAVLSSLRFKPVRGMVRGFMDMVFEFNGRYYLVDWKSNHLGYRPEEYGREAMEREMVRNRYPLQYLLYTVALNSYLSLRIEDYSYETHFGGVFYLFLRGMNGGQGERYGLFSDRPPPDLVKRLTEVLVETGGGVHHDM